MAELERRLQALSDEYSKLQQAYKHAKSLKVSSKKIQEFAALADDANIYKLVGPVLLKQDKTEAVLAVDGRLEFIDKEIKRVEKQIEDIEEKSDKKRLEIIQMQSQGKDAGSGEVPDSTTVE